MSPTIALDRSDIQGFVLRGYRMPYAACLFFRFGAAGPARDWLGATIDPVTTAEEWEAKPSWCANVALTYPGLAALGLPPEILASFPEDFRQGMAARAASHLGDTGADLPEDWETTPPFAARGVHALVLISASESAELERRVDALRHVATTHDVALVGTQHGAALDFETRSEREHFGFRDGISQPLVAESEPADGAIAPGEFLLGQVDETGLLSAAPAPVELGRNGSYLVYRKLHQDVAAFREFLRASAGPEGEELFAAKLVGRWRSGAPLVVAPFGDDPALADDPGRANQFDYAGDRLGYSCPRGSHVRRCLPRDGDPTTRRRRLIRRGLPYGPVLAEGAADDGVDRGLLGLLLNASIERQFEFVQRKWLNETRFDGLDNDPDPVTGPGGGDFTLQRRPVPRRCRDLPRFVTARGGDYFFLPSMTALRFLAQGGYER